MDKISRKRFLIDLACVGGVIVLAAGWGAQAEGATREPSPTPTPLQRHWVPLEQRHPIAEKQPTAERRPRKKAPLALPTQPVYPMSGDVYVAPKKP